MKDKRYILLDLDGTLFNTFPGISKTLNQILTDNHIEYDPGILSQCIGPSLHWSFSTLFNQNDEMVEKLIKEFRATYVPKGYILDSAPYEGIVDTLHTLYAHGKKLMIASSKPQSMCEQLIDHFGLSDLFCFISGVAISEDGVSSVPGRTTKVDSIRYALMENAITDLEHAVMIGDRGSDMSSAISLGIDCIGVSYGFGSVSELKEAGAMEICNHPTELKSMLI